ncbi:MAG: hypothetical protein PQJ46_09600 [Spirochaetales bacterium]|nr:hypothetical protein [Spirochaetales bacterium]
MKKIALILFIISPYFLFAEAPSEVLKGLWNAQTYLVEQIDGTLVSSDADYSFPYMGISQIEFVDKSFIIFTIDGESFRALYTADFVDFDNCNINCTFQDGEHFLLKLVRSGKSKWKFLYRIYEDSVFVEKQENELNDEEVEDDVIDADSELLEEDAVEEAPLSSIYIGILERIEG